MGDGGSSGASLLEHREEEVGGGLHLLLHSTLHLGGGEVR